jgi:2-oxoisovalerate ferredoxin oxidoreductase beta subunit
MGQMTIPNGVYGGAVPARKLATEGGNAKAINTVMLGVLMALGLTGLSEAVFHDAIAEAFIGKPKLIEPNQRIFDAAAAWARENLMS